MTEALSTSIHSATNHSRRMEGKKKKKIDIHLPPTCFSRRKTAFWQIYKMQLFLTIYTFIFQSGIKVLIAVAEKHNPPPPAGSGGWLMLQRNSLCVHQPASELAKTGSRVSTSLSSDHLYLLCRGRGGVWSSGVLQTE